MRSTTRLQLLVLCCAIFACTVSARARPQVPTALSEQEVLIEQACGGGWARSRYTYQSGVVINVDERTFASVQAAECAFDEAALLADQVFGNSGESDSNGDPLSRAVFLIVGVEALHIERQGQWLITRRSDSLDALRSFVGGTRKAPPN